jgi:hypothetical protein
VQAIPDEEGTFIFLESTAQGVTGKFYDMYQGADRKTPATLTGTATSCSSPHGSRATSTAKPHLLTSSERLRKRT